METNIQELIAQYANDPLKLLEALGGYYEVEKYKETGKRKTPLVGYAGKYKDGNGEEKQYVGEVYANFAKAEEHPAVIFHLTKMLWDKINIKKPVVFVGPQMGGVSVAQFLTYHSSQHTPSRYACAEKKITQLKSEKLREQSELQFARHSVNTGDSCIIVEDVLNNFSTTKELIGLIEKHGAKVRGIVGLLNRSMIVDSEFMYDNKPIPVYSLIRKPYDEYQQEDLEVIEDIANGNVILKPKDEWNKLTKRVS